MKTPVKQKKLFIRMKGELIDEKYEINLIYYHKNNIKNNLNNFDNKINQNLNNNQRLMNNYMINNNPYKQIPKGYLTENPNNINDNYENNLQFGYYGQNNKYSDNNNINPYMNAAQSDNEEIICLKKTINDLTNKIIYLESLLNSKQNYNKQNIQFGVSHNSLYVFGNNNEKEIKNKYKINDNIDNERIIARNKILELENSTLLSRIKYLEQKLSSYEYEHKKENEEFKNNNFERKKEEIKSNNNINEINKENKNVIENNIIKDNNNINVNDKYFINNNKKININDYLLNNIKKGEYKYLLNNKINPTNNTPNQIKSEYLMKDKYSSYYELKKDKNFNNNIDSS